MGISKEEAAVLVRRLAETVNAHDASGLRDFYSEDAVVISPALETIRGRDAIIAAWDLMLRTFPDWKVVPSEVFVDDNRIAALGMNTATDHKGWFGLPATGAPIGYRAVLLLTVVDGKIVREERLYDISAVLGLLEKARLDRELQTAAEVQNALLARSHRRGFHYEALGDSVPCRTIGGDFFEFVELPSGAFGIALGDVAGKGPPAALLASMLQGMIALEAQTGNSPAAVITRLNRALAARGLQSQFATLVYGALHSDGRLAYCNAGHNPPVAFTRGAVQRLTAGGPILGAFKDASFTEDTLQLDAGDVIVMFTDGVSETCNRQGEEFGEERVISCVISNHSNTAPETVSAILGAVRQFSGGAQASDDITVTVTRFLPPASK